MSDLTSLEQDLKNQKELNKLRNENRILKEKLEYFTDKYGYPDNFDKEILQKSSEKNIIDMDGAKVKTEMYKKLVDESIRDLLKLQLHELLEIVSNQNKQTVSVYNTFTKLLEQLKDK